MLTVRSSVIQTTEENIRSQIQFNGSFLPNLNLKFQQLGLSVAINYYYFFFLFLILLQEMHSSCSTILLAAKSLVVNIQCFLGIYRVIPF